MGIGGLDYLCTLKVELKGHCSLILGYQDMTKNFEPWELRNEILSVKDIDYVEAEEFLRWDKQRLSILWAVMTKLRSYP